MKKPTISQAQTLFQNFAKLKIKEYIPDSDDLFKASQLFQKLIDIQETFLPSKPKTKKKSIDTNDPFYQPFVLQHTQPDLAQPAYTQNFVPKSLVTGKLSFEEVLASIRIATLLNRFAKANKITPFEKSIFQSMKKFNANEQLDLFEQLVQIRNKPEKLKQFYNMFGDTLQNRADQIAQSDQIYQRVCQYLQQRQIYTKGCIDLIGIISLKRILIKQDQKIKGWDILVKLTKIMDIDQIRLYALKNIILLGCPNLMKFLQQEQQFKPSQIDMFQQGIQKKLNFISQQTEYTLRHSLNAIFAVCTLSPALWGRLYIKSIKFQDRLWQKFQQRMLVYLGDISIISELFQNTKFNDLNNDRFKTAIYNHLLKLHQTIQTLFKATYLSQFIAQRLIQKIENQQSIQWLIHPKYGHILIILVTYPLFIKSYIQPLTQILSQIKESDSRIYQDLFRTILHHDVLMPHQQYLINFLIIFSTQQIIALLRDISKKQATGFKWFMACLCWAWLDPKLYHKRDDLLKIVNNTVRRRQGGQFKRGINSFWTILYQGDRKKLIQGISQDLKQFQHIYLQ